jgi:hypothetical protein
MQNPQSLFSYSRRFVTTNHILLVYCVDNVSLYRNSKQDSMQFVSEDVGLMPKWS